MMDREYLKSVLHYDLETGIFRWLVTRGRFAAPGVIAGTKTKKGDIRIVIDGRAYRAHRLAWLYVTGSWPKDQIDHADLDNENNRWGNIREASNGQNGANKHRYESNRSGYKGVHYVRRLSKYVAQIKHQKQVIHLGCFEDPAMAHAAYVVKAVELHGDFARAA